MGKIVKELREQGYRFYYAHTEDDSPPVLIDNEKFECENCGYVGTMGVIDLVLGGSIVTVIECLQCGHEEEI
jgi:hypothetical protein